MRFWNIGAEGQITAGAMAATYFALFWADKLPGRCPAASSWRRPGAVAGGIWALIPAFFKAKWGTNETLFTLMMNYIIIGVVQLAPGRSLGEAGPARQIIPQFDYGGRPAQGAGRPLRLDHRAGPDRVHVHLHELHQARL